MFSRCLLDFILDFYQLGMSRRQVDLRLPLGGADVAGDVQVVAFLGDSLHRDALGITLLFLAESGRSR